MANKKRKVSTADFLDCYAYFQRAIQNNRFMKNTTKERRELAIAAFKSIDSDRSSANTVNVLQAWIDEFIDSTTWSRCYKTINQKNYLNKNKQHAIAIHHAAYIGLKKRSEQYQTSLSETIVQLLNKANGCFNALGEPTVALTLMDHEKTATNNGLYLVPKREEHDKEINALNCSSVDEDSDVKEDACSFDYFDLLNPKIEQPCKPEGYDFRNNASYKQYRQRLNRLTIKKENQGLLEYFNRHLYGYLTEDNCFLVGQKLMTIRADLLNDELFSNQFESHCFGISKGTTLSRAYVEAYADELAQLLCDFFGCTMCTVTSGKREPFVFAGNKNHVEITFKAFRYFNAFLSDEWEQYVLRCHKNTKPKNRRKKAGYHVHQLLYRMFDALFLEDEFMKHYSETQENQLSAYVSKRIGLYFDENEPIGGWYNPPKKKKHTKGIFLW